MEPTNKSTGIKSASALINNGKTILAGAHVITNGTNAVTLIVYDALSATGTAVFKQVVTGTDNAIPYTLPIGGIRCDTGMYASVSGTGAEYILFYR